MPEEEPRYTLDEAKKVLREAECERDGHDLSFIYTFASNDPVQAYCTNCGRGYEMTPMEAVDE